MTSIQELRKRMGRSARVKRERARRARLVASDMPPADRERLVAYADELDRDARWLEQQAEVVVKKNDAS